MIRPDNILLIATRQIGDVLLTTPLIRSLRHAYPTATIDILIYRHCADILVGNPDCNQRILVSEYPDFKEYLALGRRIFRCYDLAVSTLAGDRPILYALSAARQRAAIVPPERWQDAWKRWLVQRWTELDNWQTHTVVQNLRLADKLNIPRCYDVVVPQIAGTENILDQYLPFAWRTQPFVVLHLYPRWRYKQWTIQGWSHVIQYLAQKGLQIVVTGGYAVEELAYIQTVLEKSATSIVNLAGQLRFSEVTRLIQASVFYIGTDTAVTHLAAATGVPTLALYGPTNPLKWAPWPYGYTADKTPFTQKGLQRVGNVTLIQSTADCVPCHQEGCEQHRQSSSHCLETLDSAVIIQEIEKINY